MPFTAICRLFRETLVSRKFNSNIGHYKCAGRGWGNLQACHRRSAGLSGASHLVGLTVEGCALSATAPLCRENSGFREIGDKYDRKCTFPHRKGMPRVPFFGWVLFRLSGVGDPVGFVVHTSAFHWPFRSAIPGKLWFLGNFNSNIGHYNMCR